MPHPDLLLARLESALARSGRALALLARLGRPPPRAARRVLRPRRRRDRRPGHHGVLPRRPGLAILTFLDEDCSVAPRTKETVLALCRR
jgi:hypothetical protein